MSAQGRVAGRARVTLGLDDSQLQAGLKSAQRRMRAFGDSMTAIGKDLAVVGGAITAPLLGAAKIFADVGDSLDKMAARTKLSVEELSALRFIAARTGTDLGTVEKAALQITQQMNDLGRGSKTASDAFQRIGLNAKSLEGLNTDERFRAISEAIAAIQDPVQRSGAAIQFFGKRSGAAILPVIENMRELRKEAESRGLIISTDEAAAAAALTDAFGDMKAVAESVSIAIGGALAPILKQLLSDIEGGLMNFRDWVKENQQVVGSSLRVGLALTGMGLGFIAIGKAVGVAATALGVFYSLARPVLAFAHAVDVATKSAWAKAAAVKALAAAQYIYAAATTKAGAAAAAQATYAAAVTVAIKAKTAGLAALAIGANAATLAILKFVAAPVAVAIAGWKIGEAISEWTGLSSAIEDTYNWLFGVRQLTDSETQSKMIDGWRKQLKEGKIDAEEFQRRVESLQSVIDQRASGEPQSTQQDDPASGASDALSTEEELQQIMRRRQDIEDINLRASLEGVELRKAQIALEYMRARAAADGNAEVLQSIDDQYAAQVNLLNVEQQRAQAAVDEAQKQRDIADAQREREQAEADALRQREQAAQENFRTSARIEDLLLEKQYEGVDLERERLALTRARAIEEARSLGANLDLVRREFDLREQILESSIHARKAAADIDTTRITTQGAFGGAAVERAFAGRDAGLEYQKETASNTKRIVQELRDAGLSFN